MKPAFAIALLAMITPALAQDHSPFRDHDPFIAPAREHIPFVALVRESGQWANSPAAVRQWFQSLMQPDNPAMSCCGQADAFEADSFEVEGDHYVAIITDGKGVLADGTRIPVPNNKMKWDAGNPPAPIHHSHSRITSSIDGGNLSLR
jgi:hypothetical protein